MYLNISFLAIMLIVVACMYNGGLWSNTLMLFNVITSALVASSLADPLIHFFVSKESSYTFVWDYLSYWLIFALCMIVCRGLTDALSKVKVRFKKPVDMAGGLFFAAWTAWVIVCFTAMTMHTAPIDRNSFLGGEFQPTPQTQTMFGLGPDRLWLGFVRKQSLGSLSGSNEFDPQGKFILDYAERRHRSEELKEIRLR
jgi:hypothetical protein